MDASHCPDTEGCERLYHGIIGGPVAGDCCECCGQEVRDDPVMPAEATGAKTTITTVDRKLDFHRTDEGDVALTVRATDGTKILTRTIPAHEWAFIVRTL